MGGLGFACVPTFSLRPEGLSGRTHGTHSGNALGVKAHPVTNLHLKEIHTVLLRVSRKNVFMEEGRIIHMVVGMIGFHFCVGCLYIRKKFF